MKGWRALFRHAAAAAGLALALAGPAAAEMRALLVAVSAYPTLDAGKQLRGPRNDVQRLRHVLLQRGFPAARITVLADGVAGAAPPTHDRILAALDALAGEAGAGDTVVLYLGGHGSQQPADRRSAEGREEPDGLFEIFLPADVGRWDGDVGVVRNAIADHEIRRRVDRMLDRGAFVWGIFDACHAATLVRGGLPSEAPEDEDDRPRWRSVSPLQLGVPAEALAAAAEAAPDQPAAPRVWQREPAARSRGTAAPVRGGSVFFYAAQTTERTPELKLPLQHAESQPYGLFTYVLAQLMEKAPAASYRQLAQGLLAQYATMRQATVTPLFTGTALEAPVLGGRAKAVRQWLLEGEGADVGIAAGALSGVEEGALFVLLADPLADDDAALGYLQAQSVTLAGTRLAPVAHRGFAALPGTELVAGRAVRLVASPAAAAVSVSVEGRSCGPACPARAWAQRLRAEGVAGTALRWVDSGGDIVLRLLPRRVEMLTAGRRALRVDLPTAESGEDGTAAMARPLAALARTVRLVQLVARQAGEGVDSGLEVDFQRQPVSGDAGPAARAAPVSVLEAGERLAVTLRNLGPGLDDVTVLFIDAAANIRVLFPDDRGGSNRLEPAAHTTLALDVGAADVGIAQLVVLASPVLRHAERSDYSFLAQPLRPLARPRWLVATGAGPAAAQAAASLEVLSPPADRPATSVPASEAAPALGARTAVEVFTFNIGLPRRP